MRHPTFWKLASLVVVIVVAINFTLGLNLLPSFGEASQKGTFAALLITWGLVMVSVVSGLFLALFLLTAKPTRS